MSLLQKDRAKEERAAKTDREMFNRILSREVEKRKKREKRLRKSLGQARERSSQKLLF